MYIISIVTDSNGNIIFSNNSTALSKLALSNFNIEPYEKKILANCLDKNYTVFCIQINIENTILNQYIFEEWSMNSGSCISDSKISVTNKYEYNSFSDFEQEVMFALLCGYLSDKEIENYLKTINNQVRKNVRYSISNLYQRFGTNYRSDLLRMLRINQLDKYLPASLFPPGVYDYNSIIKY